MLLVYTATLVVSQGVVHLLIVDSQILLLLDRFPQVSFKLSFTFFVFLLDWVVLNDLQVLGLV